MRTKLAAGAGLCALASALALAVLATPAAAHVTVDPDSAPQGGEVTLRFRVPNEATAANVVRLDIAFPTDTPLLGALLESPPGWTASTKEVTLNPPAHTDDGPVAQAVSQATWSAAPGGGTPPGQFEEFPVLVQRLPQVDHVVFKVVQTYSDGSVERWIDPVVAGQPGPDHPTPILTLTAGAAGEAGTPAPTPSTAAPAATVEPSTVARRSGNASSPALAVAGLGTGVAALVVSVMALLAVRRARPGHELRPGPGAEDESGEGPA